MAAPESLGTILVIDDEEVMRDVLQTLLTQAGYRVTLAADGAEGLALARKQSFDAAIVDVMLPEHGRPRGAGGAEASTTPTWWC